MPQLALHDVDDAAAFCGGIVTRSGLALSWSDREDLEQQLLVECWRLSLTYQPGAASFSTWAGGMLRRRVVDWQRQRNGRTRWVFRDHVYERPRPQIVSLDVDDSAQRDRLELTLVEDGVDTTADRDEARRWLDGERDRHRDRDLAQLDSEAPRARTS